jgi:hypothetical protein
MSRVKLTLDLSTVAGRITMRCYLDALEREADERDLELLERFEVEEEGSGAEAGAPHGERHPAMPAEGGGASAAPAPISLPDPEPEALEPPAEAPAEEPAPVAPVDVIDVAQPAAPEPVAETVRDMARRLSAADPERPWTDDLKRAAWGMAELGESPADIADRLNLRRQRVHSFLSNVRRGNMRVPPAPEAPTSNLPAVARPAGAVALAEARRHPAQDERIAAARREEMAEAERRKVVTQAYGFDGRA